jgi:indolepyruvate ferredoxin oxidoreductase beta subunit
MEALRYLPWLSKEGWLISNSVPHLNIPNYPDLEKIHSEIVAVNNHVLLDADQIAKDLGASRSANMVILGAASPYLGLEYDQIKDAIRGIFKTKGTDIIDANLKALDAGRNFALSP